METPVRRRVSATATGFGKPAGAMNSAFDTGARPQRGGVRKQLPPLKADGLKVIKGPPPEIVGRCMRGQTKYDALFDKLTADDMGIGDIPAMYKASLKKAVQTYVEHRPALKPSTLVVRHIDADTVGVWLVAGKDPAK